MAPVKSWMVMPIMMAFVTSTKLTVAQMLRLVTTTSMQQMTMERVNPWTLLASVAVLVQLMRTVMASATMPTIAPILLHVTMTTQPTKHVKARLVQDALLFRLATTMLRLPSVSQFVNMQRAVTRVLELPTELELLLTVTPTTTECATSTK
jgi:hypothetical protein